MQLVEAAFNAFRQGGPHVLRGHRLHKRDLVTAVEDERGPVGKPTTVRLP